ncbi:MAG: helix-turn-helix domain-containing protein [Bacteroidetes bacterium]|nr:helix-turn-helix domain-containing protein [Bacteroidota bacterium]
MITPEYISADEAEAMTSVSAKSWKRYAIAGTIAFYKPEKKYLFKVADVRKFMETNRTEQSFVIQLRNAVNQ